MKLLFENWRKFLEEEKQLDLLNTKRKNLADDYYIEYDFTGRAYTDKVEVPLCGDLRDDDFIIGGTNETIGTVYLVSKKTNEELMNFRIHKYNGWLGNLRAAREMCVDYDPEPDDCSWCFDDVEDSGVITDRFAREDLYSGHWGVDGYEAHEEGLSDRQLAKLGIALREAALSIVKEKLGAKYYVFTNATHEGGSNVAAQKVVKILIKRGALGKPIDLAQGRYKPEDENEHNKYLVFPISNPKSDVQIQEPKK